MEEDKDWKPTSNGPLPASRKRPVRSTTHRSCKEDEYDFLDDDKHPQMGRVVPYKKHSKASTSREVVQSEVIVINDSDDESGSRGMSPDKKDTYEEKTSGQNSGSEGSSVSAQYLLLQQNGKLKEKWNRCNLATPSLKNKWNTRNLV